LIVARTVGIVLGPLPENLWLRGLYHGWEGA
jgi:hypothetical protein